MTDKADDYSEWAPITEDELVERMQRNEADLQNKDKNPHQLPAEQNTRMAEHHRYLVRQL